MVYRILSVALRFDTVRKLLRNIYSRENDLTTGERDIQTETSRQTDRERGGGRDRERQRETETETETETMETNGADKCIIQSPEHITK